MDPADSGQVRAALIAQGQKLHQQDEQLAGVRREVAEATQQSESTCAALTAKLDYVINRLQGLEHALGAHAPDPGASAAAAAVEPASISRCLLQWVDGDDQGSPYTTGFTL